VKLIEFERDSYGTLFSVATSVVLVVVIAVCVILSILVIGTICIKWYARTHASLLCLRWRRVTNTEVFALFSPLEISAIELKL